ncbi:MAG: MaoC family dehydratase [Proteobacteria bacterium]|nr:MaoC family dehydratase [Pseudomonadota bacterium]MCP4918753.1 MaoC family dehydratase [Pseudomonadota bacterium]
MIGHLVHQRQNITSTLKLVTSKKGSGVPELPGPETVDLIAPRPKKLVSAYLRTVGGNAKAWKGQVPPHLFPQWAWPALTRCMNGLPYDMAKVVNAGCSWTVINPLPANEPLQVVARIERIVEDEKKALITLSAVTGTATTPECLRAELTAFVPKPRDKNAPRKKRSTDWARIPLDARAIFERRVTLDTAKAFASQTGDPNPIHWSPAYAKASGFKSAILHGFATAAIAGEALVKNRFAGDVTQLTQMSARFNKPVRLPSTIRVFTHENQVFVGNQPGGPALLTGSFNG